MYAIYTTIYGITIPEKINNAMQSAELFESLFNDEIIDLCARYSMDASVPYSGDDAADFHYGHVMSIDTKSTDVEVTDPVKESFEEFNKEFIELMRADFVKYKDDMVDVFGAAVVDHFNKFIEYLENTPPSVYRAYSTS